MTAYADICGSEGGPTSESATTRQVTQSFWSFERNGDLSMGELSVQFLTGCEWFSETLATIPQTKAFRGANPIVIVILPTPRVPLDVQGTGPVLELDF